MSRFVKLFLFVCLADFVFGNTTSCAQQFVGAIEPIDNDLPAFVSTSVDRIVQQTKHAQPYDDSVYETTEEQRVFIQEQTRQPWVARVGLLLLNRQNPGSVPLFLNTSLNTVVDAGNLDFGTQPGVEAMVIAPLCDCWSGYGRYFWVDKYTASAPGFSNSGGSISIATDPPTTISNDISFDHALNLSCKLQSAEIGLRRELRPWLFVSGAFRWIELDERFHDDFSDASGTFGQLGFLNYQANNDLYGLQLGLDGIIPVSSWLDFDYYSNAGVYHNSARVNAQVDGFGTGTASGSRDWTAFVAEIGVGGHIRLSDHVWLHSGYRVLWIDGVAMALNQVAGTPGFGTATPITLDMTTAIFYGGDFSLEVRF